MLSHNSSTPKTLPLCPALLFPCGVLSRVRRVPIATEEEASFVNLIPGISAAEGVGVDSYRDAALVLNIL